MDAEEYVQLSNSTIMDLLKHGYLIFGRLELNIDMNSTAPTRRITKIFYANSMSENKYTILQGFP